MFNVDDIIVWHNIAHGPKEYRVVWVYNEEPKTLLITDNLDDLTRHGLCFHAPMHECQFVRKGIEFKQTRKVVKHDATPDFLRQVDKAREDI
jgi:hypothetical protein